MGLGQRRRAEFGISTSRYCGRRGAQYQPVVHAVVQTEVFQSFAEQDRVGLTGTTCRILLLAAVDQSVEKSSSGDDYGFCADSSAVAQADT